MKHRLLLPLLLLIMCSCWLPIHAEDIDVLYMITTLNSGAKKEVMLTNDSTFIGPKILHHNKTFILNGTTYSTDEIKEIRFEQRTIDAIITIDHSMDRQRNDNAVYNLNGQKVCDIETFESQQISLPKGIYIVNGKKIINK